VVTPDSGTRLAEGPGPPRTGAGERTPDGRDGRPAPGPRDRPQRRPGAAGRTCVAIVEDHNLFAEVLEVALTQAHHDVRRVPLADHVVSTGQLVTAVLRANPDVVLLDLDLGAAGNGARLVTPLTEAGIAVVVFTGSVDLARWGECVGLGALTVLPKTTPLAVMLTTIRLVGEGMPVLEQEDRDAWLTAYHREAEPAHGTRHRLESLTVREGEVLAHLMAGRQVRDIAQSSSVAEATVRSQVKSILAKLNVSSQIAAVGAAYTAQWRPPVAPVAPDFTDMRDRARLGHS
jgi:two-component system, NarL family, nitrate/nitrite response regulator NarL